MKQIAVLVSALAFASLAFGQSSLQEGNGCFAKGDYACAIEKYKEAIKSPDERQKKIAGDNLRQAEKCFELRAMADAAFNNKNFIKAKEYYQSVLDENTNDEHAKARLNEIKIALITLSVSKSGIMFSSAGGNETIYITTEADSYSVGPIPSWCSIQKFEKYIIITCTENIAATERSDIFTVSGGSKMERINIRQSGKKLITTFQVSKKDLLFSGLGGTETVYVTTDADSYSVGLLPSWCFVQKFEKYIIFTCTENTSPTERTDILTVSAGGKRESINIHQFGKQVVTPLSVSKTHISFNSGGKSSEQVLVYTSAPKFSISLIPPWCSVQTFNSYFTVTCSPNKSPQPRSSWLKVTADKNVVNVDITQEGNQIPIVSRPVYTNNTNVSNKIKKTNCFNCPKTKDPWGITAGYSQLDYGSYSNLNGVHLGLRIEPLFKYGFGLNTGLILNAYLKDGSSLNGDLQLGYYGINVPLHMEYRFNFSKTFSLFGYGGAGFNVLINSTFDDKVFPATLEYGGGFRVGHVQFNGGKSSYMGDFKNFGGIGKRLSAFQRLVLSVSYMF